MYEATQQILERSFRIAWDYLEATGELGDPHAAAGFLRDTILSMMQPGETRPLLISNRTIDAYKRRRTERAFALVS